MIVQVLYAERNIFTGEIEWYDHVADVDAPEHYDTDRSLEYAFRRLQNIDGSWSKGPTMSYPGYGVCDNPDYDHNVTVLKPLSHGVNGQELGHRSCMMGDHMIIADKMYEVGCVGFKEVVNA